LKVCLPIYIADQHKRNDDLPKANRHHWLYTQLENGLLQNRFNSYYIVGCHSYRGIESLKNVANDGKKRIETALILNSGASDEICDPITSLFLGIHGSAADIAELVQDNFNYIIRNLPDLVTF
jgi:hypothetical protein